MRKINKISIIGAGLGGLALAQGLLRAGFHVKVFERDESSKSRSQGYRISIRTLGLKALAEILTPQKMERLSKAKIADVGDGFTLANEKMEPFFKIPKGQDAATQFLRSELRRELLEGIDVQWNKRLIRFEEKGDQVISYFEDGSENSSDLLIGCDGAGSIVRDLLSKKGSIPLVKEATRAILGGEIHRGVEWDLLLPLNKEGLVRFIGPSSYDMGVSFSERADRSPTVFWAFSEEIEDRNAPWYRLDKKAILERSRFLVESAPWHENLKKLVFMTKEEEMMPPWLTRTTEFPDTQKLPMSPRGRVTLLGDAAHPMPAEKGLGGNHALEDARVLSTLLAYSDNAVEEYEKEMFARAKLAVQESENAAVYFRSLRYFSKESAEMP